MIVDLNRFIARERPYWTELEQMLGTIEAAPEERLTLDRSERLQYLYQRASGDLARVSGLSADAVTRRYLESLTGRAYGEIYETRDRRDAWHFRRWLFGDFPRTFRRHIRAFWLSTALTLVGCAFGVLALAIDRDAKRVLLPFSHLQGDPRERVAREEAGKQDRLGGSKGTFSAELMTHNTRVALLTMALGATWGAGTVISLFYNGVILGAVSFDYVRAGQGEFLLGWLMPHGVVEIPSILIAGQAGFLLAGALIGWGDRTSRRDRLRRIAPDLVTIIGGVAVLLVWAGIIEAFVSQYHQPVIPYALKIGFGAAELLLLVLFLSRSGSTTGAV
jgi:uncharacterized membrane protein SpoIIM required for sporulation